MENIIKKIESYEVICIYRHISPDGDALGSQFGLEQILKANFPNKMVYTMGEPFIGLEKQFPGFNHAPQEQIKNSLAIILDTANSERIDDKSWSECKESIKIDHHPLIETYATYEYVNSKRPATSQIIVELANQANWTIPKDAAKYLYIGIIMDTGRFMYRGTDENTFKAAITLLESGIDLSSIYNELNKRKLNEVRFNAYMQLNFNITGNVAWIYVDKTTYEKFGLTADEAKYFVSAMAGIEGVEVWMMCFDKDDFIRVSIRSRKTKINHIAEKFEGGGHELASGAKVRSQEQIQALIAQIQAEITK